MEMLTTVLNPGVLFFILGLIAVLLKSNLAIPDSVVKFVSIYLMLSIGFKGGVSLHGTSILGDGLMILGEHVTLKYSLYFVEAPPLDETPGQKAALQEEEKWSDGGSNMIS